MVSARPKVLLFGLLVFLTWRDVLQKCVKSKCQARAVLFCPCVEILFCRHVISYVAVLC